MLAPLVVINLIIFGIIHTQHLAPHLLQLSQLALHKDGRQEACMRTEQLRLCKLAQQRAARWHKLTVQEQGAGQQCHS